MSGAKERNTFSQLPVHDRCKRKTMFLSVACTCPVQKIENVCLSCLHMSSANERKVFTQLPVLGWCKRKKMFLPSYTHRWVVQKKYIFSHFPAVSGATERKCFVSVACTRFVQKIENVFTLLFANALCKRKKVVSLSCPHVTGASEIE